MGYAVTFTQDENVERGRVKVSSTFSKVAGCGAEPRGLATERSEEA